MTRNKKMGILLLAILPLILFLYAVVRFIASVAGMDETMLRLLNVVMSLGGVLGVIVGLPAGIYFLVKRDPTEVSAAAMQNPKYQNLTPEQTQFIHGWSWGAFFGTPIWQFGNKMYLWGLLGLIPLVNIYIWLKSSADGRAMAWERGEWESYDQFRKRQKILAWILWILFILGMVFNIIAFLAAAAGLE